VAGNQVYDTGWVLGTAATFEVPANVLPNSVVVTWTLQVQNTDGLVSTLLTRTFTTNFTTPPALTNLVLTPDPDALTIEATWDASTLPAGEFERYIVSARSGADQFRVVGTITNQAAPSFTYRAAGHNLDTIIRVTQDNGWAESAPVEASATLAVEGVWRVGPDGSVTRLRYLPPGTHSRPRATESAEYSPPGAEYQRVVLMGAWGVNGRMRLKVPPEDASVVALLQEDHRTGRIVLLKTGKGLAAYSVLRDVTPIDGEAGWTDVDIVYTEVGPEAAGF
jgi:hypothetical protein